VSDFEKTVLEQLAKLEVGQKELRKNVKDEFEAINTKLKKLEDGQEKLKTQVKENTAILKALEHSSEVNKAERDKMENDIAHIQGNIVSLKGDVSSIELSNAKNTLDVVKLKAVINQ
jgi:septal ring factor EnvC (AmiA/AmiB activator)